jgi:hypothetical protein
MLAGRMLAGRTLARRALARGMLARRVIRVRRRVGVRMTNLVGDGVRRLLDRKSVV